MKNKKSLLIMVVAMLLCFTTIAQPPKPPTGTSNSPMGFTGTNQDRHSTYSIWRVAPIGTSTILMLVLGGSFLALGVAKNTKKYMKGQSKN